MWIVVIHLRGEQTAFASSHKKLVLAQVAEAHKARRLEGDSWAWRLYRVGDGWCDGSVNAWKLIDQRPACAQIIYS